MILSIVNIFLYRLNPCLLWEQKMHRDKRNEIPLKKSPLYSAGGFTTGAS